MEHFWLPSRPDCMIWWGLWQPASCLQERFNPRTWRWDPGLVQLHHRNGSRVVWGAAEVKILPETAELQDWDIWSGLVIAGQLVDPVYCSWTCCGPAWALWGCPPCREPWLGIPGRAACSCGSRRRRCKMLLLVFAMSKKWCSVQYQLLFFLVSISLIIFNSRICSLPVEGLWSLTVLDVQ